MRKIGIKVDRGRLKIFRLKMKADQPSGRLAGRPHRRFVVYGVTGSGKTTLGSRLARGLGLDHIELDALYHGPNWTPASREEFLAKVQAAIDASPRGWIADGNYGTAREVLLPLADAVIWLRLPWRVSYTRMLRRTFGRMVRRQELWNGNRETLRNLFLEKDSLLLWGIRQHRPSQERIRAALSELRHSARIFEVRSGRELEALVQSLLGASETARHD